MLMPDQTAVLPPAIETHGLRKQFGRTMALDGLDLEVPAGSIYALLGPNGAGKTTAIRILATLARPDAGTARVLGLDVEAQAAAVRRRISLTAQFASIDADLNGRENMTLFGALLGLPRAQARTRGIELIERFGLAEAAERPVRTYSGGMRRRLDLAASVIVAPELLFLDEPTTGLDPRSRSQVWEIVRALVADGTTVVLTTQYLDEADQLADRIGIIDGGRLIAEGTPGELKASLKAAALDVRLLHPEQRSDAAAVLSASARADLEVGADPALLRVPVTDAARAGQLLVDLGRVGVVVSAFALGQPSLDEVFLALTDAPRHRTEEETAA